MKHLPYMLPGLGLVLALLLFSGPTSAQRSLGFQVIVHSSNPVTAMNRADLSGMFLRRVRRWPNGRGVDPIDQPLSSRIRQEFSEAIHRRSATSVASYWRQQIFSGRSVPPAEKANDSQVLRYVASHPDAIGYVSTGVESSAVRALRITGL